MYKWFILSVSAVLLIVFGLGDRVNSLKPIIPKPQISDNQVSDKTVKLEKEKGNVTVTIEYLAASSGKDSMVFSVALNTHSVDLDAFDFGKDVVLEKDSKSYSPVQVNASGSIHHRKADLTFKSVETPFTIVVKNISNIDRREFVINSLK